MKGFLIITFLILVALASSSIAQTENRSNASQVLKAKVESGDYNAVTNAGNSGDLTLIPYLRELASNLEQRSNPNSAAFRAHIALAKLGDETALEEILTEVDAEDPGIQDNAMSKLSAIGNDAAFRKFYQLLDDTARRENAQCKMSVENFKKNNPEGGNCGLCCDVIFFPRSTMAMFFLSMMVHDPPTKNRYGREKDIPLWKQWFQKNKPFIQ